MQCLTCTKDVPVGPITPWYVICPTCATEAELIEEVRQATEKGRSEFEYWRRTRQDFWHRYMIGKAWTVVEFTASAPYDGCFHEQNWALINKTTKEAIPLYISARGFLNRKWTGKEWQVLGPIPDLFDSIVLGINERSESGYYVLFDTSGFQDFIGEHPSTFSFYPGALPDARKGYQAANIPLICSCDECGTNIDLGLSETVFYICWSRGNGGVGVIFDRVLYEYCGDEEDDPCHCHPIF